MQRAAKKEESAKNGESVRTKRVARKLNQADDGSNESEDDDEEEDNNLGETGLRTMTKSMQVAIPSDEVETTSEKDHRKLDFLTCPDFCRKWTNQAQRLRDISIGSS
ncbi:hypothetical protein AJ79_09003 [Helicocarpus griseus UAMH5409]|uniref:Uncharacterized protein n=1 Tax=Helicocarpus griseus UAMH5409 TaxID=1447875 RepID=A0A2B7WN14_9EURO|nr:hypothetical protein AJ79_09003 [Helicocarpus griseus UAMH5409]